MAELTKLTPEAHGQLKVAANSVMELAATQHVMNLRVNEVAQAACDFPMFFSRNPQTGGWAITQIASLIQGHNLFVEDGRWTAISMPLAMQTYPLFLMNSEEDEKGYAIGIDAENPAFTTGEGEALFDESGQPSIFLNRVSALLDTSVQQDIQTHHFLQRLDELKLFREIDIQLQYADGQVQSLNGLHSLDEDVLKALPTEQVEELNQRGYLTAMHAMMVSIFQINSLIRKHNLSGKFPPLNQAKIQVARDPAAAND